MEDDRFVRKALGFLYAIIALVMFILGIMCCAVSYINTVVVFGIPFIIFVLASYALFSGKFYILSLWVVELYIIGWAFWFGSDVLPIVVPFLIFNGMAIYHFRKIIGK